MTKPISPAMQEKLDQLETIFTQTKAYYNSAQSWFDGNQWAEEAQRELSWLEPNEDTRKALREASKEAYENLMLQFFGPPPLEDVIEDT
jgi:hypothetical protein